MKTNTHDAYCRPHGNVVFLRDEEDRMLSANDGAAKSLSGVWGPII
jgi:hypothetical protein